MVEEGDDEELYADLYEQLEDGRQVPKTSLLEMEERMGHLTKQTEEMQMKMDSLQKQNDSLQRDKDVLIRNISCLFKTAQMEIARKNKQINELREELSKKNTQELHPRSLIAREAQMKTTAEEFPRDRSLNKVENNGVQTNGSRETRHVDSFLEMERCNPYDSEFAGKKSGEKSTRQTRPVVLNSNDETLQAEAQMKTTSEEFLRDRSLNKVENNGVQTNGSRETRHVDSLLEMERCNPYDSKFAGKGSGEKSTRQARPVVLNSNNETLQAEAQMKTTSKEFLRDRSFNKVENNGVQTNGSRETRHVNSLLEMERCNPYDSKLGGKRSGEKSTRKTRPVVLNSNDETLQALRDSRRPRTGEVEQRSLEGKRSIQDKHFFKDHHENRKERMSSRHDKFRESHVEEKRVQQVLDIEKDHQITQHRNKDSISYDEFRDNKTSGRTWRDADRMSQRTTNRSMNGSSNFSGDDSHATPKHSAAKRKATDEVYNQKQDSYNDRSSCKIQKSNSFVQNRTDEERFSNVDAEQQRTSKVIEKDCNNDFRDNRTSGRTWRDADRMSQRTTNRSMNGSSNFSGDDSHATPKHSAGKRKATDEIYNQKQDSYNDQSSCKIQKGNSFVQNRTDEKRFSNVDAEQQRTSKVIEKDGKNDFRDNRTSGRTWRDADRMSQRTPNRSMNGSSNFSGDDSHATPKHSAAKRKATDEVYNQKQDSYNDRSSCKIQKSNSFVQNRTDEKRFSNVDAEQQRTSKVIEKDDKNDYREDKNRGKVCIEN